MAVSVSTYSYLSGQAQKAGMTEPTSAPKMSTYVMDDKIFTSDKKYLKDMESIIAQLTMREVPLSEGYEGGVTDFKVFCWGFRPCFIYTSTCQGMLRTGGILKFVEIY